MIRPINIKIIKRRGEDWFRLCYSVGKKTHITTQGFTTRDELAQIIKDDTFFKLNTKNPTNKNKEK